MAVSVLVVTPVSGFGELIRQVLEETGGYRVTLVYSGTEALARAKGSPPDLCVLDQDLDDMPFQELAEALRTQAPDHLLVLISLDEEADDQTERYPAAGYVPRPFYMPRFLEVMTEVAEKSGLDLTSSSPAPAKSRTPSARRTDTQSLTPPYWLQDVDLAAQHLTRLSLEADSQAALITRNEKIWAYAGELPQKAAKELAVALAHYWDDDGGGDLARFLRLETTGDEHMLYATTLGGEYVLALVFDAEMPFFEIRSQASSLARALMYTPDEWAQEAGSPPDIEPEVRDVSPPVLEEDWESVEADARPVEEVFITEDERLEKREPFGEATLKLQGAPPFVETAETELAREAQEEKLPSYPLPYLAPEEPIKEEVPFVGVDSSRGGQQQVYALGFACLLIPRMPDHRIKGDLAKCLQDWVVKLHLAFGWRLKQLAIAPESLHWLAETPPDTSPGRIIEVIREHTSQRIFKEFPRLKEDNPSGDFWALSYLQISGATPLAQAQIQDFIRQTRLRQGVPK